MVTAPSATAGTLPAGPQCRPRGGITAPVSTRTAPTGGSSPGKGWPAAARPGEQAKRAPDSPHALGEREGEAVDSGVVERRHVTRADQRLGQAAAGGLRASATCSRPDHRARSASRSRACAARDGDAIAAIGEAVAAASGSWRGQDACAQDEVGDGGTSSSANCGRRRPARARRSPAATMEGPRSASNGVPRSRRCTSSLGCGKRLKPSTRTRSTGRHPCQQRVQAAARRAAQLVDHRPAPRGGEHHLPAPASRWRQRVLARLVEIDLMMGVLDRRHPVARAGQVADEPLDQRRLAVVLPARRPRKRCIIRSAVPRPH